MPSPAANPDLHQAVSNLRPLQKAEFSIFTIKAVGSAVAICQTESQNRGLFPECRLRPSNPRRGPLDERRAVHAARQRGHSCGGRRRPGARHRRHRPPLLSHTAPAARPGSPAPSDPPGRAPGIPPRTDRQTRVAAPPLSGRARHDPLAPAPTRRAGRHSTPPCSRSATSPPVLMMVRTPRPTSPTIQASAPRNSV